MSFRLSGEAREYFRVIDDNSRTGTFETLWDKYYLCLMAGISRQKIGKETGTEWEFFQRFIEQYRDQRYEIIAAFVAAETQRRGIPTNETETKNLMIELLDPESPTCLTDAGHRMMNKYAEGGFECVREEIMRPHEFDRFMLEYVRAFIKEKSPG